MKTNYRVNEEFFQQIGLTDILPSSKLMIQFMVLCIFNPEAARNVLEEVTGIPYENLIAEWQRTGRDLPEAVIRAYKNHGKRS